MARAWTQLSSVLEIRTSFGRTVSCRQTVKLFRHWRDKMRNAPPAFSPKCRSQRSINRQIGQDGNETISCAGFRQVGAQPPATAPSGSRPPRLFFTDAGLVELRAMMADRRLADPVKFAHIRRELGIDPA
jgi:hypothetical protein